MVREDLQGGTRRDLLSVFLHKKYIHSCSFYLSGSVNKFLNFCVAYFPCCFLKMAIKISHGHFVHVAFVSILVFQTLDRMIFGTLTFRGTRWYVMTVRDTQMVRDQKKFENHWARLIDAHHGLQDRILLNITRIENAHKVHMKTFVFVLYMEVQTFSFLFSLLRRYKMPECFYVNNSCFWARATVLSWYRNWYSKFATNAISASADQPLQTK